MKKIDFLKLAKVAVKIAEDKKGENVVLLDVQEKTPITNYFVIATANSMPQINAIINEIEKGIKKTKGKYKIVEDRKEAIKEAIKVATKRDIIILAGKGHEPYQEINGTKYPFDERIIVKEILKEN